MESLLRWALLPRYNRPICISPSAFSAAAFAVQDWCWQLATRSYVQTLLFTKAYKASCHFNKFHSRALFRAQGQICKCWRRVEGCATRDVCEEERTMRCKQRGGLALLKLSSGLGFRRVGCLEPEAIQGLPPLVPELQVRLKFCRGFLAVFVPS